MALFGWFDAREIDAFADSIVAQLREGYPPGSAELPANKAPEKLRKRFGRLFGDIDRFARRGSLNLYKRARLGNRVKWALKEAGYPAEFVETFTRELVVHVAVGASREPAAAPDK